MIMTLLATLRDWLKASHLDAVLIASRQNKQPHLGFSSGSGYVMVTRQQAHILVDFRYLAQVNAPGYHLHLLDSQHTLAAIVNQCIADEGLKTLGFEGEHVSWQTGSQWRENFNATLVSVSLDALRQVKTAPELALIREACRIAASPA